MMYNFARHVAVSLTALLVGLALYALSTDADDAAMAKDKTAVVAQPTVDQSAAPLAEHDFGAVVVRPSEQLTHRFTFHNGSADPWVLDRIHNVKPCCVSVAVEPSPVPAGGKGSVALSLRIGPNVGSHQWWAELVPRDRRQPTRKFAARAVVLPPLALVDPFPSIELDPHETKTIRATLRRYRSMATDQAAITIASNNRDVIAELDGIVTHPLPDHEGLVKDDATITFSISAKPDAGWHACEFTFDCGGERCVATLCWRVATSVRAEPGLVRVPLGGTTGRCQIVGRGGRGVKIQRIEPPPHWSGRVVDHDEAGATIEWLVSSDVGMKGGVHRARVVTDLGVAEVFLLRSSKQ